jgi:TonB family protein
MEGLSRGEGIQAGPQEALSATPQSGLTPGEVANEVLPEVPQSARDTITGTVRVSVKVHIDDAGGVTAAELDSPGPSQYFARLALQASRLWTFIPPKLNGRSVASEWILRFGFTRTGTTADPVQSSP